MVIDEVSLRRTAKGAAMNGSSGNGESVAGQTKEKPSKKSKSKSAKKNGKAGNPPSSGSDERPHWSEPWEHTEAMSPAEAEVPTPVDHVSGESEVLARQDNTTASTLAIDLFDVDEPETDELVRGEPVEPASVPETDENMEETPDFEVAEKTTDEALMARSPRPMRVKAALIGAGALIVALAVLLTLSLSALSNQNAIASSRTSALSSARTYAVELASYNYRNLHRDFSTVAANSTPSFRRTFDESSNALKSTLSRYKATAVASVESAGVVSASTSRAVVLVFLDQKIANSTQTKPTTDRSQVEVTVVRSGGRWLVDQVKLL